MIESNLQFIHRMSLPGEWAQYASTGENAEATVLAEQRDYTKDALLFDTRTVHYNKLLDLTDPAVRQSLGVALEEIARKDIEPFAYEVTHQIGFLAKKYGFDGIKFTSTKLEGGVNIVRLIR